MPKCLIHYFSGTGNTYHMIKVLKDQLANKGYEVDLLNIEKDKSRRLSEYGLHIFCYPVYGFGTPTIMLKYISNLKYTTGCKAAIVCTSAGFEGQSLNHFKHILNKKGFEVFLTDMIIYTYNWTQVLNPQSKEVEAEVFRKANVRVIELTKKIINNETYLKTRNIITLALSWVVFIVFGNLARRILGKTFIADDACISCGKCKNICPSKTIEIYNGKPRWNWNCESCQRCINMCPKESIQLSIVKLAIIVVLELLPILIIVSINNYIINLPIIFDVIIYSIMFAINTILADILISLMEKVALFKRIFNISYTKKYRRNVAEGFNIH